MADKEPPMTHATPHPSDGRPARSRRGTILAMRLAAVLAAVSVAVLTGANANASSTSLDDAILATAPAYYYPLTTNAADASGHSNPALTIADVWNHTGGTVTYTGSSASFDGEAFLADGPAPTSTDFAVGAWFKMPKTVPAARTIVSAQGWILDGGQGWVSWSPARGSGFTVNVAAGVRHQIVASDHAGTLSLYVDGKLRGTHAVAAVTPGALSVGSLPGQADFNAMVGNVSSVAGWTHSVTGVQVAAMWSAGSGQVAFHRWAMLRHIGGAR